MLLYGRKNGGGEGSWVDGGGSGLRDVGVPASVDEEGGAAMAAASSGSDRLLRLAPTRNSGEEG
jgi:hypothetical protein